jgi:hypothetical protein
MATSSEPLVLKKVHDNENDTIIAYKDAEGKVHLRFVDVKTTVKEARELALQEFQVVVKEADRAVLKFREWLVVEDELPLLPKYVYLLAVEPPFVGKQKSTPVNLSRFTFSAVEPPSYDCLLGLVSMKMFKLDDIIGAIEKTPIACSPPADVVQKYFVVNAALDDLRDEENYRDDISSYNSVDDKFDMCVCIRLSCHRADVDILNN